MTTNLEAADHADIFVSHGYPEHTVDLGEIQMNYAVAGDPSNPAMLLIPAQTESWWGYEQAMRLLADRYQVYSVDLGGQGRSTWTPGRYSLDIFGGDLVRVIGRPVVVCGLSSGGTVAAWLSAYAAPGQIHAAVYEDAPLFASQANPAVGPSIRQSVAPMFELWHKWLGAQWSIGDFAGMQRASGREIPGWMLAALQRMAPAGTSGPPTAPRQDLLEYDPEWGDALASGRATLNFDHDTMLRQVKVPVLFTHHFHHVDPDTGNLLGALTGRLDVVINNAGHLVLGYTQAFTAEEFNQLFDVNAAGAHRVNKAVPPHFRQRRHGVLMYIGSTIPFSTPPFFGPYVVSKAAMDALAVVTSYEANAFGIETVIVMPGAITQGTEHFPNAGHPDNPAVAEGYVNLDPLVAPSEKATNNLFGSTVVGPDGVAEEIVRVLHLPFGEKPFRAVIDDTNAGTEHVGWAYDQCRADFVRRMGYGELLRPRRALTEV